MLATPFIVAWTQEGTTKNFLPFVGSVLHLTSKFTYIVYESVFADDDGDGDGDATDVATAAATIANSVSDIRTQHFWSFDETSEQWLHTEPSEISSHVDQVAPGFRVSSIKTAILGLPRPYCVSQFNKFSPMCIHIIAPTSLENCNSIFKNDFYLIKTNSLP